MSDNPKNSGVWKKAALGGAGTAVVATLIGSGLGTAAVVGLAVTGGIGFMLGRRQDESASSVEPQPAAAPAAEPAAPEGDTVAAAAETPADPAPEPTPAEATQPISASSLVKPSTPLPGQADLAARKGSWKYEG
ncbi:hypothetical protein [Primorskyibacter sp. S87]|uniref:hypothetical protein n=1 Tax=Primorskyibacter sp. S87 TaxID=3415126 RepID=UPI003C7E144E